MTIKREINGVEYEFELTWKEKWDVVREREVNSFKDEFLFAFDENLEIDKNRVFDYRSAFHDDELMNIMSARYYKYMSYYETGDMVYEAVMDALSDTESDYPELIAKYKLLEDNDD